LYTGYVSTYVLYRRSQFRFTAPRYENVFAFVYKPLRRCQPDAAIAAVMRAIFPSSLPILLVVFVSVFLARVYASQVNPSDRCVFSRRLVQ
jgi:hypothetical protein